MAASTGGTKAPAAPTKVVAPPRPPVHVPGTSPALAAHTGGVAAPGTKTQGQTRNKLALKAPHAPQNHATAQRAAAVKNVKSGGHAAAKPAAKTAAPEKNFYEMKTSELEPLVKKDVTSAIAAEEQPYKARVGEIGAIGKYAENHYQKMSEQGQKVRGELQANSEATARTTDNEAATAAKAQLEQVPMTPPPGGAPNATVEAQQNAERQMIASRAGAQEQTAQRLQGNESEYMTKLQAAAAQRATEGQAQLAGRYAEEEGVQNAKEAALKAEKPGEISSEMLKLLPEKQKGILAEETLQNKKQEGAAKIASQERKNTIGQQNANTKVGQLKVTAGHDAAQIKVDEQKNTIQATNDEKKNALAAEKTPAELQLKAHKQELEEKYKLGSLAEKKEYDESREQTERSKEKETTAKIQKLEREGGVKAREAKAIGEISKAITIAEGLQQKGMNESKIREELLRGKSHVASGMYVQAAFEIASNGYVSANTRKALESAGAIPKGFQLSQATGK